MTVHGDTLLYNSHFWNVLRLKVASVCVQMEWRGLCSKRLVHLSTAHCGLTTKQPPETSSSSSWCHENTAKEAEVEYIPIKYTFQAVLRNRMNTFICRVDDSENEIVFLSNIKFSSTRSLFMKFYVFYLWFSMYIILFLESGPWVWNRSLIDWLIGWLKVRPLWVTVGLLARFLWIRR